MEINLQQNNIITTEKQVNDRLRWKRMWIYYGTENGSILN